MKIEIIETDESRAYQRMLNDLRLAWGQLHHSERYAKIEAFAMQGRIGGIKAYRAASGADLGEAVRVIDNEIARLREIGRI